MDYKIRYIQHRVKIHLLMVDTLCEVTKMFGDIQSLHITDIIFLFL